MNKNPPLGTYKDSKLLERYTKFCEKYLDGFKPIEWQLQWFDEFLCTRRSVDNYPFYRISCNILPKKSGKTFFLATVLIFLAGERPKDTLLVLAQSKETAKDNIFGETRKLIEANDFLSSIFDCQTEKIINQKNKTIIKLLSGQNPKISGYNTSFIAIDEFLEIQEFYFSDVWLRLVNADMAKKTGGQIALISMPSMERHPTGHDLYLKTKLCIDAREAGKPDPDPRHHGMIYGVPEGLESNPESWWDFLPSVQGGLVQKQYYIDEYQRVKDHPVNYANFRCLLLGQFCSTPEMWHSPHIWPSCETDRPEEDFIGCKESAIGIDFASTTDLCSWCTLYKEQDKIYAYSRFIIPANTAEKRGKEDSFKYLQYAKEPMNKMYLCNGDKTDGSELIRLIMADASKYKIRNLVYDPAGMEVIRQNLQPHFSKTLECNQYGRLMPAVWRHMDQMIVNRQLLHGKNQVLDFCYNNCKPEINKKDELVIVKSHNRARIDGIDAMAIGLSFFMQPKEGPPPGAKMFLVM
jgi:phage terminase large subunit-like protein